MSPAASALDVRLATQDDLGRIHRFAVDVVPDTYDRLVDATYSERLVDEWWTPAVLEPDVAAGRVLIADTGDRVVGLVHVGEWEGEPVMWKLYVAADRRDAGLGVHLVDALIDSLPVGTPRLRTEHIIANERAARFYQREGFEIDGIVGDPIDPTSTVWRSKPLPDDWTPLVAAMERVAEITGATDRCIARALATDAAASIVDVGCGAGSMTVALAEAFPDASVVAADTEPAMRTATRRRLARHRVHGRVVVSSADIDLLAERQEPADLIWASAVVHHRPDQEATLRALYRAVAPGGRLALAEGGLPQRTLPWDVGLGRPGLEVRLDAALDAWFRSLREDIANSVSTSVGWPSLLRRAGFGDVTSQSFLVDVPAPLDEAAVRTVVDRLRWVDERLAGTGLADDDDSETLRTLLDERDTHYVGRRDDLFVLSAQTVHLARR